MTIDARQRADRTTRLKQLLHITQLQGALLIVVLTSACLMAASIWTIARYADQNLKLVGRTMVYNLEAPLVFQDRLAAMDVIVQLAATENLARVAVFDDQGQLVALHHRPAARGGWLGTRAASWLLQQPLEVPIVRDGVRIGSVQLSVHADVLAQFLLLGLLQFLAAVLLSVWVSSFISRHVQRRLMQPIDQLSEATRRISSTRAFDQRVPGSPIVELAELAADINLLISEVQKWQGHVEREKAQLAFRAEHDPLTGLANRSQFEPAMERAIAMATASQQSFGLLCIDCDNFKSINDNYGHAAGDQVLTELAQRLRQGCRAEDCIIRVGGDEFAVIMTPLRDAAQARRAGVALRRRVKGPVAVEGGMVVEPSVSIGIALFPQHGRDVAALRNAADLAMYQAKLIDGAERVAMAQPIPGEAA